MPVYYLIPIKRETIDDVHASVRFKYGIHTIYLFVDLMGTMATVGKDLRELLRDRYPEGLTKSFVTLEKTPVPDEASKPNMAYAVLNVSNDPTRGWKRLQYDDDETTPANSELKQNGIVAFTFLDDPNDEAVFDVEWPKDDEELEDAEE
ncbi:hypothetical protein GMORB2_3681 [Geosmithia morbida]|uniref:Uncharacterized protein n=1 Tax=Geosmithia morbida TaxID=1094350 RepID=A0A9P4YYH9_9HYPO|nr:uncharacterized protein GMORB2_3681 [Geosmithia morbida]KAF4124842.1 hypothetical protein GMORB2_3681 [Geosmithia morbida]